MAETSEHLAGPHPMEEEIARAAGELADADPGEILRWATARFGDRICVTSSMTDAVIVHMAASIQPGIDVLFLDTGYHFAETLGRARSVEWDARREMVKVNPIVSWTEKQVDDYVTENGVLVNPLVSDGYTSVGCSPCTRLVAPGDDPRSGRWAATGKAECGIHL